MGGCASSQDQETRIQRYEMQKRQLTQQILLEKARVKVLLRKLETSAEIHPSQPPSKLINLNGCLVALSDISRQRPAYILVQDTKSKQSRYKLFHVIVNLKDGTQLNVLSGIESIEIKAQGASLMKQLQNALEAQT